MISNRSIEILEARLSGKTLRQVGRMFEIHPERVRQVAGFCLRKLRNYEKMQSKLSNLQRDLIIAQNALRDSDIKRGHGDDVLVSDMVLSVRASNCLRFSNYETSQQLSEASDSALLSIPNFGRGCLQEVRDIVGYKPQGETT